MIRTPLLVAPILAAGLALTAALPAGAADPSKEIRTAITHAGMAAGASDLKSVQAHLHHVVNCLVGPKGSAYDASQADPCKGQGDGAITDAADDKKAQLQEALALAQTGVAQTDVAKAKETATSVQAALKKAAM